MTIRYWAVKPVDFHYKYARIEKAGSSYEACRKAFGGRVTLDHTTGWHAKDMGTRVSVIQSGNKRIALLENPDGWSPLSRD